MEKLTVDMLIARIKDASQQVRTSAWQSAGAVGATALVPLATVVKDGPLEVSRAAARGMWQIVHYSGRPGADAERRATVDALLELLADDRQPAAVRRDVVWMLSEIIDGARFQPKDAAKLLANADLREDVRAALVRIPGENATAALKLALGPASGDFKTAIACALRARGVDVPDIPCPKLLPAKRGSADRN
jgi:HEAT repeat protein